MNLFTQNDQSSNRAGSVGGVTNLQSSALESKFQINPEILENVGFLYTRNLNFPELRRIQDFSIVHFNDAIRDSSLARSDVNLFILDGPKGNIIYSSSSQIIKYFHDNRLENYQTNLRYAKWQNYFNFSGLLFRFMLFLFKHGRYNLFGGLH